MALPLAPFVAIALAHKFIHLNDLISPGGYSLVEAQHGIWLVIGLAVLLALALPGRWRLWALIALDLLGSVLALSDTMYLRYFDEVVPAAAALHGVQAFEVHSSIGALFQPADLLTYFKDVPLLLAAIWARRLRREVPLPALDGMVRVGAIAAALFCINGLAGLIHDFDRQYPNALSGAWSPRYTAATIGVPVDHLVDIYYTIASSIGRPISQDEVNAIAGFLQARHRTPAPRALAPGANLIFVQIEALQGFTIGQTVGGQALTPNLNRLVQDSIYFPNIYAQNKDGTTSDSEFMLNTGLYPAPRGAAFVRYSGNQFAAMPRLLRDHGYQAVAMHANAPGFWNRYAMYPSLGFERFESADHYVQDEPLGMGLSDRSFLKQSLVKLQAMKQPFFAWMVTLSSHHPYEAAAKIEPFEVGTLKGTQLGNYLKSVHYVDTQLGAFIAGLKADGLYDRSVIVMIGDHPAIKKDGQAPLYALTGTRPDTPLAWRNLQKVPLLIHLPGNAHAGRNLTPAGQVDVLPTLADILGFQAPLTFGQDLLRAHAGYVILADGAFISGNTLVDPSEGKAYDLTTQAPRPFGPFVAKAAEARHDTDYSAEILAHNLIPQLAQQTPAFSTGTAAHAAL